MRFAVHRPGYPVASPRSHGVPRRDVNGRVHIRVADETAGNSPEHGLALTRVPAHLPARQAPLTREMRFDPPRPARRLVLRAGARAPHPDPRIPRFSPALARTFRPGLSRVPLADRVMFPICRSSTRITSNRPRDVRGDLLGPVFAPVGLPGLQPGDRVLDSAPAVRAPLRAGQLALQSPQPGPLPPGQGGGSAAARRWTGPRRPLHPGRSPRPRRYPAPVPARGSRRRRHATAPPGPIVTR